VTAPSRSAGAAIAAWSTYAVTVAGLVVFAAGGESTGPASWLAALVAVSSYSIVGAVVVTRDPRNTLGWLFCAAPCCISVAGAATVYVEHGGSDWPARPAVALVSDLGWMLGIGVPVVSFGLLVPDGRLPSRRWRPAAGLACLAIALVCAGTLLAAGEIDTYGITNPIGIAHAAALTMVAGLLVPPLMVIGVAAAVTRFRHGTTIERQQLKWIVVSLAAMFAIGLVSDVLPEAVFFLSWTLLPLGVGVAILRHQLYDIDVIIRRTAGYSALLAALAAVYLGGIVAIGWLLRNVSGQSSVLAVTLSTIAVAATFHPLRTRIQRAVDRRFYRRRYDAEKTLDGFTSRLRDEIDLEALSAEVVAVVNEALQPDGVNLWLRLVTMPERPGGTP
jgi:hypothetical protein